jgi:hypothetical protein
MDVQLENIIETNEIWLEKKLAVFLEKRDKRPENFNGLLGEIRAYGELLDFDKGIMTPESGSDFIIKLDNININIEINSPQESKGKTTTKTEGCIRFTAPFGYPVRKKDNIQYEAISKFASIKKNKEGKQFKKSEISILWLDMNFPDIFIFNLLDEAVPVGSFNSSVTSGSIWNAFYGLKDDKIYSDYHRFPKDVINMEFDGRFKNSNIDFLVVDFFTKKVVFENPYSKKEIPNDLYKFFLNLYNIQNSHSYLSFGKRKNLKKLISMERSILNNIEKVYKIKNNII